MKKLITILSISLVISCSTKETISKFNFDFENYEKEIPTGWIMSGGSNYILAIDSANVKSGKYASSLEFQRRKPGLQVLGICPSGKLSG
jgi:hypothetical protein